MLISMGSAREFEYHSLLARYLGYLGDREYRELCRGTREVERMLSTLVTKLRHTKKADKLKCREVARRA